MDKPQRIPGVMSTDDICRTIILALSSPLYMASRPSREHVLQLAREHGITAEQLLLCRMP
jgi:hypothetical protein